jgi:N-acylneuraminate cytidylyltransferase
MLEFSMKNEFDNILLLQATSPLVTTNDIDNAFELFYSKKYDSILSVVRQKRFIWNRSNKDNGYQPINYDVFHRPRRQEFDGFLVENGAIYITRKRDLEKYSSRLSGSIGVIEMDDTTYYEIDELNDWVIVENLLRLRDKNKLDHYKNVKCIITDCDGVLTDGGMYYSENGDELKKFNTKDGMGLRLAQENGIKVGIITGEDSKLVKRRAEKLNLDFVYLGIKNKLDILDAICKEYSFKYDDIVYIGDDLNDLEVIKKVGHSFAVNDASPILKSHAKNITKLNGGAGAVREVCDLILSNKIEKS